MIDGFNMAIDVNVNGAEKRIIANTTIQEMEISEFSVINIRDWEFLIILKENPNLIIKGYS